MTSEVDTRRAAAHREEATDAAPGPSVVSTFPRDPSGAREVAPPEESDETNEMAPGAGHDDPHPATEEE